MSSAEEWGVACQPAHSLSPAPLSQSADGDKYVYMRALKAPIAISLRITSVARKGLSHQVYGGELGYSFDHFMGVLKGLRTAFDVSDKHDANC